MRAGIFFLWALQGFAAFNLTWGMPPVSLDSSPTVGDTDVSPVVALAPSGNAITVWGRTSGKGATEDIWATFYSHTSRVWTGAMKISGGGNSSNPSVAVDENGYATVVWEEGFPTQIFYRTLNPDGIWMPPLAEAPAVLQESKNAQTFPQIALDQEGNALALWMEFYQGKSHIHSAKRVRYADWTYLGPLTSDAAHATLHLPTPLAMNVAGDAWAVWTQGNDICGAKFQLTGHWGETLSIGKGKEPSVGIDGAGNGLFVWNQEGTIASRRCIEGALSDLLFVSNPLFLAQRPCVGLEKSGDAVVVFERFDGAQAHKFVAGATWPKGAPAWSQPVDISIPSPAQATAAGYPILSLNAIGDGVAIWKEAQEGSLVIQGAGYSLGSWSFIRSLSSKSTSSAKDLMIDSGYNMRVALNLAGNIMAVWPEDLSGARAHHIKSVLGTGLPEKEPLVEGAAPVEETEMAAPSSEPFPIRAVPGVGLAVTGPLPPLANGDSALVGIGKGFQEVHRFPAHRDYINILDWTSSGDVAYFKVYRNALSSLIGTTSESHYEDHRRTPGEKVIYLITSVDHHEHESSPMTIVVDPH